MSVDCRGRTSHWPRRLPTTSGSLSSSAAKMPCMKAGRSSGVRLVTMLPSRTQAASCQMPPAFSTSSRMAKKPVTFRPFRHLAEQSIQGPWQIAARTCPCRAAWVTRSTIARMPAHVVGRVAAGDDDRVEVRRLDLAGGHVRLGGIAVLGSVRLARLGADDLDVAAGLAEPQDRIPELQVFVELLDQDGHALAFHVAHDDLSGWLCRSRKPFWTFSRRRGDRGWLGSRRADARPWPARSLASKVNGG